MSWYLPAIEKAIGDRLTGDTATGGLCAASPLLAIHPLGATTGVGVYNTLIPLSTVAGSSLFPAVVFTLQEATREGDGFREIVMRTRWEFAVIVDKMPAYNPLNRGSDIMARILGDWTEQVAGTAPTYGLDHFKPTLAGTSWVAGIFTHQRDATAHEPDRFVWLSEYEINISRQGV